MKLRVISCLLCMLLLVSMASAQTNREQPVTIEADRVDVDDAKGTSVYKGHVVLRQGTMELKADELHIITNAARELESIKALGNPATFKQSGETAMSELRGRANEITYQVNSEYMLFVGGAYFWQCGDEMTGEHVEYFGQDGVVKARKSEQGQGRVQVTLQPRGDEQTKPGCK